ncbi:hypothetical protein Q5752_006897 [Cryptotrichosporon argae]
MSDFIVSLSIEDAAQALRSRDPPYNDVGDVDLAALSPPSPEASAVPRPAFGHETPAESAPGPVPAAAMPVPKTPGPDDACEDADADVGDTDLAALVAFIAMPAPRPLSPVATTAEAAQTCNRPLRV